MGVVGSEMGIEDRNRREREGEREGERPTFQSKAVGVVVVGTAAEEEAGVLVFLL